MRRHAANAERTATEVSALSLAGVGHSYGGPEVVHDFDLDVGTGEIVCLLGPSGCGKTTVLRVAAGLERLQRGAVLVQGREVATATKFLGPEDRDVGLVFQEFALFPHLSVAENVGFGLSRKASNERAPRVHETLELVGLLDFARSYPHELSGGEQQRVALARALAPRPRVMLLDEPFSGLDTGLRSLVRDETLHLLKNSGAAVVLVTHDPEEAMFMADRIVVMREGVIEQAGAPSEIYFRPQTAFVAGFLGEVNQITGIVSNAEVASPFGALPASGLPDGSHARILIRPEAVRLTPASDGDASGRPIARVVAARHLGRTSLVHLTVTGDRDQQWHLHSRVRGRHLPSEGEHVGLDLEDHGVFVFPVDG